MPMENARRKLGIRYPLSSIGATLKKTLLAGNRTMKKAGPIKCPAFPFSP